MTWSTAEIPSQRGRTALVTGVGGIGFEAGLALARSGASLILAGRNPEKGRVAVSRILAAVSDAKVRFERLDLASLSSVEGFCNRLLAQGAPLDLLINNAGLMAPPKRLETADGFEIQFGTNYLGHFALTLLLLPLLAVAQAARVVSVSSVVHRQGAIHFEDLQSTQSYNPQKSYAQSKLAMLMFALELERRLRAQGSSVASISAHPGIARTELFTNGPGNSGAAAFATRLLLPIFAQSPADGALPLLYAATAQEAQGGGYFGPSGFLEFKGPPKAAVIAPQAQDPGALQAFWGVSADLTGLDYP